MVLPSDVTRYQLDGLQPGTEYRLTLYTLLEGREVATPATVVPTGEGPVGAVRCAGTGAGMSQAASHAVLSCRSRAACGPRHSPPGHRAAWAACASVLEPSSQRHRVSHHCAQRPG